MIVACEEWGLGKGFIVLSNVLLSCGPYGAYPAGVV
jgi:hypothetical protein